MWSMRHYKQRKKRNILPRLDGGVQWSQYQLQEGQLARKLVRSIGYQWTRSLTLFKIWSKEQRFQSHWIGWMQRAKKEALQDPQLKLLSERLWHLSTLRRVVSGRSVQHQLLWESGSSYHACCQQSSKTQFSNISKRLLEVKWNWKDESLQA